MQLLAYISLYPEKNATKTRQKHKKNPTIFIGVGLQKKTQLDQLQYRFLLTGGSNTGSHITHWDPPTSLQRHVPACLALNCVRSELTLGTVEQHVEQGAERKCSGP